MAPIYYEKRQPNSKRNFFVVLFLGLLITTTYFITKTLIIKSTSNNISEKEDSLNLTSYPTLPPSSLTPEDAVNPSKPLEQVVQNALTGTFGSYGIVVKNLKTGENYSLNEHVKYHSASLYKLWIMAETYRQIKNGILTEDEILSEKVETLNGKFNVASESAELTEGTITLSVKDALEKMITISDNYAALLLSLKIRLANVASFLKANGFDESTIGTDEEGPTTTTHDTTLFFEKLYNLQIVDKEYSEKMLQLLKQQKLNEKLPRYLPENTVIAHKTGELDEYTHDAGIVYANNYNYIIVVLSKSDNPDLAKNRISNVSDSVYNYFANEQ